MSWAWAVTSIKDCAQLSNYCTSAQPLCAICWNPAYQNSTNSVVRMVSDERFDKYWFWLLNRITSLQRLRCSFEMIQAVKCTNQRPKNPREVSKALITFRLEPSKYNTPKWCQSCHCIEIKRKLIHGYVVSTDNCTGDVQCSQRNEQRRRSRQSSLSITYSDTDAARTGSSSLDYDWRLTLTSIRRSESDTESVYSIQVSEAGSCL